MAHRRGIVAPADFNEADAFCLRWRALRFILKNNESGAEAPLVLDQILEAESTLFLRIENTHKTFRVGERLTVTTTDFTDHCFTLFAVAEQLGLSIIEYGRTQGFDVPQPPQPPTSDQPPPLPAEE